GLNSPFDLILTMFDVNTPLSDEDMKVIRETNRAKERNKKVIIIENKIDLEEKIEKQKLFELLNIKKDIKISLKEQIGIEQLEEELVKTVFNGVTIPQNGVIINNIRQAKSLKRAARGLKHIFEGVKKKMPHDILTV
ncbi:unnamed protein product, partial [marine sediment metagenome]